MPTGRPWEVKSLLQVPEPGWGLVLTQEASAKLKDPGLYGGFCELKLVLHPAVWSVLFFFFLRCTCVCSGP